MKLDVAKFVDGLHAWFGEQVAPLVSRLKALESRPVVEVAEVVENVTRGLDPKFVELYETVGTIQTSIKEISLIPGPQGAPGAAGEQGAQGPAGEPGKDATVDPQMIADAVKAELEKLGITGAVVIPASVSPEEHKHASEAMEARITADVERRLSEFRPPADGRDGLHIEIIPAIDAHKSYPRNTYAKHDGGLWRSFEKTSDMRGWECIVDGIAEVQIEQHNERTYGLTVRRSSGATEQTLARVPAMVYRGVFRDGETYEQGDTVTWGGSLWHANEDTQIKPGTPGEKSWSLAAKRGRDGTDGRNGIDAGKAVKL